MQVGGFLACGWLAIAPNHCWERAIVGVPVPQRRLGINSQANSTNPLNRVMEFCRGGKRFSLPLSHLINPLIPHHRLLHPQPIFPHRLDLLKRDRETMN
jgi:hypothetical protein